MTMTQTDDLTPKLLVDWRAAVIAGFTAGSIFLAIVLIAIPWRFDMSAAVPLRYIASIVLGESVLPPPAEGEALFALLPTVTGVLVHYVLSLGFTLVLAYITHRWGLLMGVLVGAVFGAAVYAINIYTVTLIYEWFYVFNTRIFLIAHVLFGAVAGGLYEAIEVERHLPAKPGKEASNAQ